MSKYNIFLIGSVFFATASYAAVSTFQDGLVVGDTSLTSGLLLEVEGRLGAQEVCNESGSECSDVSDIFSITSGGGITGGGTGGYLPKFSNGVNLNNSVIQQSNDNNIGIGVAGMASVDSQVSKLRINGNLKVDSRHLYLGNQDLYSDNGSYLYFDSNNNTRTALVFRDAQNTQYGQVFGDADGAHFGLLDGDGNWTYYAIKDDQTQFRINNDTKLTLFSNGLVRNNYGRGNINWESNPIDAVDGSGVTMRTLNNPSDNGGAIFSVRSSGSAPRLWVGQAFTSSGSNHFYVGTDTDGKSNPAIQLRSNGDVYANRYCDEGGGNCKEASNNWGTWTSVSRVGDTWYQNTNDTGLMVAYRKGNGGTAYVSVTGSDTDQVFVQGVDGDSGEWRPGEFVVPPGHYYKITGSGGFLNISELVLPY